LKGTSLGLVDEQLELQLLGHDGLDDLLELLPADLLLEAEAEVGGELLGEVQRQGDVLVVGGVGERVLLEDDLLVDFVLGEEVVDGLLELGELGEREVLDDEADGAEAGEVGHDVAVELLQAGADDLLVLGRDRALRDVRIERALADEWSRSDHSRSEESGAEWAEAAEAAERAEREQARHEREAEAETEASAEHEERLTLLGEEHGSEADEHQFVVHS